MIRYDLIVQEALLGAVRTILRNAARDGLPGDHHFFITFKTTAPGVELSQRMRRQYPEEMTIVLQHQFWDLVITDIHFEVGLSFKNVPEKLSIPFHALTGFADPSVEFALSFDIAATNAPQDADSQQDNQHNSSGLPLAGLDIQPDANGGQKLHPMPAAAEKKQKEKQDEVGGDPDDRDSGGATVVSIDAFRKKT